jgi:hypothetical protein
MTHAPVEARRASALAVPLVSPERIPLALGRIPLALAALVLVRSRLGTVRDHVTKNLAALSWCPSVSGLDFLAHLPSLFPAQRWENTTLSHLRQAHRTNLIRSQSQRTAQREAPPTAHGAWHTAPDPKPYTRPTGPRRT